MSKVKGSKIRKDFNKKDEVKINGRKLKNYNSTVKEMKQSDKDAIQEENFSILFIFVILLLCFVAGISLGYCLYKIALNSAIIMI